MREVMKASKPVDLDSLPAKPELPPDVIVPDRALPSVGAGEVVGSKIAEAAPTGANAEAAPAVDLSQANLGDSVMPSMGAPAPRLDLAPPAPLTAGPVRACLSLWSTCRGKGYGTDVCVRDLARCEQMSPTVEGLPPCCPTSCGSDYAARRRGGTSFDEAGRATFHAEPGGCLHAMALAARTETVGAVGAPLAGAAGGVGSPSPAGAQPPAAAPAAAPTPTTLGGAAGSGTAQQAPPAPKPAVAPVPVRTAAPAVAPRPQAAPRATGGAAAESEPHTVESQPIP